MKFPPALAALLVLSIWATANAAELKQKTLAAWDHYIETVDARLNTASARGSAFLRIDEDPGLVQRLQRGEVIVSQVKTRSTQAIPNGIVHDWIGAVFVPNATLTDALAAARDYEQYPTWFGPTIRQATLLGRTAYEDRFTILYVRKVLFVTAALETESMVRFSQVDATRWYSVARSSRIQEINEYGHSGERKMPPDDGSGYLWRAYSVSKYEQRDEGVYIEQETIGLSRQIPAAYRWIVGPAVRRLSRDLMEKSLYQTREAVLSKSGG